MESRRKKVRDLYAGEMQQWQDTILNSQESLEEHKERIRKRAYLLKSQREEEVSCGQILILMLSLSLN